MEITLRAIEFEPDERLKTRAKQKVARLQRYVPDLQWADIELTAEPTREVETRYAVRVNLIMYGKVLLRVERKAADPYVAIDAAVDTLKEQLLRYKEKRVAWRHHQRARHEQVEKELEEGEAEEAEEV